MPPKPTIVRLRLDAAASPARVADAARMFGELLEALGRAEDADDVTLKVDNYDMGVKATARTPVGERVLELMFDLVSDPVTTIRTVPESRELALVIASYGRKTVESGHHLTVERKRTRKPVDEPLISALEGAATSDDRSSRAIGGTTTVRSRVLRVGRVNDRAALKARIDLDGRFYDVAADESLADQLFDLARREGWANLAIEARWLKGTDDLYRYQRSFVRIVGVEPTTKPASGAELLDALADKPRPSTESLADFLADLSGDD